MGHADPTRIAGQIASGIGFLGAGAILRDGLTIRGLTTAATVWCAAAIGSLAGAGMLVHAVEARDSFLAAILPSKRWRECSSSTTMWMPP